MFSHRARSNERVLNMKKRDKKNLKFLLALDESGLKAWYDQCTEDDIEYAVELIRAAQAKQKRKLQRPSSLVAQYPSTVQ